MASNLNRYQIVGISLVITGVLVEITASMLYTWFIFNFKSTRDLMGTQIILYFISTGGWAILYTGFFLLFWDIGKKITMPQSYTIVTVLILVMAISVGLLVISGYILWIAGINDMPITVYIVFHDSIPVFTDFAALLTGIALLLLSKKKLNSPQQSA